MISPVASRVRAYLANMQCWSTDCDWITCTRKPARCLDLYGLSYWQRQCKIVGSSKLGGEVSRKEQTIRGYKGIRVGGGIFWGTHKEQGEMIVASSGGAAAMAKEYLDPCNVSRLDLQVTLWSAENPGAVVVDMADYIQENLVFWVGTKPQVELRRNLNGIGTTCTVGARTSDTYLRIYDKQSESGENAYRGAVRYEVELKGQRARDAYDATCGKSWSVSNTLANVAFWFGRVGLHLPPNMPLGVAYNPVLTESRTDIEQSLEWLERSVRKTVERLRLVGVSEDELQRRLGLSAAAYYDHHINVAKEARKLEEVGWRDALEGGEIVDDEPVSW